MRKTYRLDMSRPRGQRLVEKTSQEGVVSTQITPDVAPYRSMITGEVIGGRAQHREHLRRHGCEEVGNDKPDMTPKQYTPDREAIRDAVREAKRAVEWGEKPTLERLRQESPRMLREMGLD